LADFNAELEQLAMDPGLTPQRVGAVHLSNQVTNLAPVTASRISNANAKTSGIPDGATGSPLPA
jgi:hypothetical protein